MDTRLVEQAVENVSREVSPEDRMHVEGWRDGRPVDATEHYFAVGASALRSVAGCMGAVGKRDAHKILDLPCGHGRVLRFFRSAWPESEITACDILEDGVQFCAEALGAVPVHSRRNPADIELPNRYDLAWCGSLLTHLPEHLWDGFLRLFVEHLEPGGLLVLTTHGSRGAEELRSGARTYGLDAEKRRAILSDYDASGFGFAASAGRPDYGFAFSSPAWVRSKLADFPSLRLVSFEEHAWGGHQDVVGCAAESAPVA